MLKFRYLFKVTTLVAKMFLMLDPVFFSPVIVSNRMLQGWFIYLFFFS